MSEYQYYEFQAIDKPLKKKDMHALRELSSRAQITPTSFVNSYNWGNFRGDPLKLMEKYFDVFLYVANWGTHWSMLRVPLRFINFDLIRKYCLGENVTAYRKGENLVFEFNSDTDDYEWEEGEGWLSSLISLRSDIIHGDYRCLYLGWLYCAQAGDFEDDESEPPVPPNLDDLNAPLKSFVDFMRIDTDLVAVAAENSASKDRGTDQKGLRSWINNLPEKEKDDILLRLIKDHDPHLGTELMGRFQQTEPVEDHDTTEKTPRTVEDLMAKAETYSTERERRIAEQQAIERARKEQEKAIAREKYLNDLTGTEDAVWKRVDDLINKKRSSDYDEAVLLLTDLRDLSKKTKKEAVFEGRLGRIREEHYRKVSLISRLSNAGLE